MFNKPKLFIFLLLGVLALTSLACSFGSLSIGNNSVTVEVKLSEEQINSWIQTSHVDVNSSGDELLDHVTSIEMHEGFIRVFGTATQPDGSEAQGSYDVAVSAADGLLKVEIIAVNILGIEIGDARITKINQQLADDLNKTVTDTHNGDLRYEEASIANGVLTMKVTVTIK